MTETKDDHERRLEGAESRIYTLQCLSVVLAIATVVNLFLLLLYFQKKSEPDWDFISVTLTIFEILLALALVGGFWMVRGAAQRAAAEEARLVTKETALAAKKAAEDVARIAVRRQMLRWDNFMRKFPDSTSAESGEHVSDLVDEMRSKERGGRDGNG